MGESAAGRAPQSLRRAGGARTRGGRVSDSAVRPFGNAEDADRRASTLLPGQSARLFELAHGGGSVRILDLVRGSADFYPGVEVAHALYSCVPCRDSSRHIVRPSRENRRRLHECQRGTQMCARYVSGSNWISTGSLNGLHAVRTRTGCVPGGMSSGSLESACHRPPPTSIKKTTATS